MKVEQVKGVIELLGQPFAEIRAHGSLGGYPLETEDIGDLKYVSIPQQGISLVLGAGEEVATVQLHRKGHEGYMQFSGELPAGLAFSMSRQAVRQLLGPPTRQGERQILPVLGRKPAWDSYTGDHLQLHIEYTDDEREVQLVSIAAS
ncbi:hypothetical protein OOT46_27035 [Aquabacterium sp. A7-Y]|uniref:hypothetical protein n=1 Tax=Aquabacterium sp. A7-Y TaxID=1349605 RepID=UPI00223CBDF9|nr:hypothetical protein [Aquabacterium sp. A7-Y]MCW7541469.1 hypothetical protein [Aquabacterium sp. A7-Y]